MCVAFAALSVFVLSGCGGAGVELVDVQGVVTLDGQPLPQASVMFAPVSTTEGGSGRPSMAMTNDEGWYQLQYSTEFRGVRPGSYKVTISTFRPQFLDNLEKVIPRLPEKVPDVYNMQSTLTADVKEGQDFNFELKSSEGSVVQPDGPPGGRPD